MERQPFEASLHLVLAAIRNVSRAIHSTACAHDDGERNGEGNSTMLSVPGILTEKVTNTCVAVLTLLEFRTSPWT